ncbi:LysM peptidoglycan-binding domain-containing protein [Ligilactobacillus murinus]|uniref:LysM peptidoglycan-binding domain-containing protein n=1 Tax=Ligilactobacillus murinus TaxID=1622 RepID=UPI00096E4C28|nr:LysM peptidoglycan-binding domain-containing protein [Ligilactobacillus murinus]
MAKLTDGKKTVDIFAESEQEEIVNKVAQYSVQSGNAISDHTQRESIEWTMTGLIQGKDHNEINNKWAQLMDWQYRGVVLSWRGAIYRDDFLIESMTKDYDEGGFKNAIKVNIKFKGVTTVQSSFVRVQHVGPITPPAPPGLWVTVVAGNTYWGWWKQYGTPIQTLRNWNKWPDRRIPIGARARVK